LIVYFCGEEKFVYQTGKTPKIHPFIMKNLLFCVFVITLFISCNNCKPDLKVNAKVIRSVDSIFDDSIQRKVYKINLSLINNSNFNVGYWIMSCSWYENWMMNNDQYRISNFGCDGNYPKKVSLKAKDSILYKIYIEKTESPLYPYVNNIRFGFIFIDTVKNKTYHDYLQIIGDISKWNNDIIWSNPILF
jgi:hypothetical protein